MLQFYLWEVFELKNGAWSFIVGCLVGAAVGILYAPKAGKETREDVSAWLDENFEQGRESYEAQRERVLKAVETGRENVAQKSDEVRIKIEQAKERLKEQVDQATESAREKINEAANRAQSLVGKEQEKKSATESAEKQTD